MVPRRAIFERVEEIHLVDIVNEAAQVFGGQAKRIEPRVHAGTRGHEIKPTFRVDVDLR